MTSIIIYIHSTMQQQRPKVKDLRKAYAEHVKGLKNKAGTMSAKDLLKLMNEQGITYSAPVPAPKPEPPAPTPVQTPTKKPRGRKAKPVVDHDPGVAIPPLV